MAAMSDRLSGAMAFKALQPLDGHGFADLVMTPRRPAGQLAPLHRVDRRTLARSPIRDQPHRRLQLFCYLHDCSGCFRLERLPSGPCTHCKAPPYSRRTRRADVADSAVAAGGKRSTALNAIERLPRAVLPFGSPSPAFGRSRRRAVLALASPEQRLGGRAAMEPSRLVLHPTCCGVRRHGRARAFRSSRQAPLSAMFRDTRSGRRAWRRLSGRRRSSSCRAPSREDW
jgi:hypothetical protein